MKEDMRIRDTMEGAGWQGYAVREQKEGAGLQRERMERNRIVKDRVKGLTG